MNTTTHTFITQIENYLGFLSKLPADDISKLEKGEYIVKFEIVNSSKKSKTNSNYDNLLTTEFLNVDEIIANLYKLNTRDEGDKYLTTKCTSKADYILVIKKLDVPFEKKDSIEKIKNKIIEGTIGFRIRSMAIRG